MTGSRKRMYLLHRWTGLTAALLGMLVFTSGAVVTFREAIEGWATRGDRIGPLVETDGFDLDAAWAAAARGVDPKYLHQVDVIRHPHGPLGFFMHEHVRSGGQVSEVGVYRVVDPRSKEVLVSRTGRREAVTDPLPKSALAQFFLELHTVLLMPRTLGLVATGLVGFALTVLLGTGILVHRPTFRKLTNKLRTQRARQLSGDLHAQLGSWTLPYTIVLAMTGMFFSFATTVLIPVVAMAAFNGDQTTLIRTLLGHTEVSQSSAVARLDPMFRDASARTVGGELQFLFLDHWGQDDANAVFFMRKPDPLGDLHRNHVYDGHSGAFIRTKPRLGTEPSFGGTLFQLMGDLHFGTLLGIVTKAVWAVCGLLTALVACLGLLVFCLRNTASSHPGVFGLRLMTVAVSGGLPLAIACAALAWVASCSLGAPQPMGSMRWVFVLTLAFTGLGGGRLRVPTAVALGWAGAAIAFLALPLLGPLATGRGALAAWADPATRDTVAVDIGFVVTGLALAVAAWLLPRRVAAFSGRSTEEYFQLPAGSTESVM